MLKHEIVASCSHLLTDVVPMHKEQEIMGQEVETDPVQVGKLALVSCNFYCTTRTDFVIPISHKKNSGNLGSSELSDLAKCGSSFESLLYKALSNC